MTLILRQSTAVDVLIGPFVDDSDGKTAETALTLAQADILLSKNGQGLGQKNDDTSAQSDLLGYYNCELNETDTNTVGSLVLVVHESGALPVRHEFQVIEEAVYDALYESSATGLLPTNVTKIAGATVDAATAQLGVNVVNWKGSAAQAMTGDAYGEAVAIHIHADDLAGHIMADYGSTEKAAIDRIPGSPAAVGSAMTLSGDYDAAKSAASSSALATAQADLDVLTGTDGAKLATSQPNYAPATASALATAQADLDTITGSDGVSLATAQAKYAPAKAGDQMDLVNAPNATAVSALKTGLGMDKVQAAVYDTASVNGNVITLSNGKTQTFAAGGRTTTP